MPKKPKRIAAFFDAPQLDEYPFDIELYRKVYKELGELIVRKGGEFYIVRGQESFIKENIFSHGWKFDGTWFAPVKEPIELDLIWNKGHLKSDASSNVINDPALDELATNKWKTYEMFVDLHAPSRLLETANDWEKAQKELTSDVLVIKPIAGYGGENITIAPRSALANFEPPLPGIAQEFVDTSHGIPGIVDGKHDLRVIMINEQIGLSYIRTPPEGGMKANVSQGGKEIEVMTESIPKEALKIITAVDAKLKKFRSRIYTVDMGRDTSGKWYVFELNTKPGFSPMESGKSYEIFFHALTDFLMKNA